MIVREYKASDYNEVLNISMGLWNEKVNILTTYDKPKNKQWFSDMGGVKDKPFNGYFVAEIDNRVVGVLVLKYKNQIIKKNDKKLSGFNIVKKYGVVQFFKMIIFSIAINHRLKKSECYIDYIVTDSNYRGRGIGGKLLDQAKQFCVNNSLSILTLSVISRNKGAIRLYEKKGFKKIKKRKYPKFFTKQLNSEGEYFMGITISDKL